MKADKCLEDLGVDFEEVVQDNPTKGCDEAARERGVNTSQIVKSLIIESEEQKFHILIPGDRELSEKKFGSEYRMVSPEEAEEITGFEPGTVHPFSTNLDHIVDEKIFEKERVSHTVGEQKQGLIIESDAFREALEESNFSFEVRDIVVSTEKDFRQLEEKELDRDSAKFVVENGYRRQFLDLVSEYSAENISDAVEAFERKNYRPDTSEIKKVAERAKNQTHMLKLVESLKTQGELPENSEEENLGDTIQKVLNQNPGAVEDLQEGKDSAVNYLMGQVMEETNGRADGGEARELIMEEVK